MSEDRQTADSLVGSVLEGGYRIVRSIGVGGMGAVYEAVKLPLNNRVAIKVMARELAASAEALKRFHREAELTSGLGHPHIVQVFDFGAMPTGEPFLVMEFLQGEDLFRRISRLGHLSLQETLHIVKQVASALAATHAKDIVHRDLKPANIFILDVAGETNFVKVLDFGISKVRAGATKLTRNAARLGTPDYMSPEQAMGQVDVIDQRTDQWALACIAWEALSGRGPFVADDGVALLFQVVNVEPAPLAPKVPGLRPEIEQVLRRALRKRMDDRFPSVTEFALAFESAVIGAGLPHESVTTEPIVVPVSVTPTVRIAEDAPPLPGMNRPLSTTLTHSAGEMAASSGRKALRRRWLWALPAGAAVVAVSVSLFLLRLEPAQKPVSSNPPTASPAPPAPIPPPVPARQPETPAKSPAPEAAAFEAGPENAKATPQGAPPAPPAGKRKSAKAATSKGKSPAPPENGAKPPAQTQPKVDRNLIEEL